MPLPRMRRAFPVAGWLLPRGGPRPGQPDETEGTPVTDAEIALLRRLRDVRNDAVHGRSTDLPDSEDVRYQRRQPHAHLPHVQHPDRSASHSEARNLNA